MTLKAIFDIQFKKANSIIDSGSERSIFTEINNTFFSIVSPIHNFSGEASLLEKDKIYTTDELNLGFIKYKLIAFTKDHQDETKYFLSIKPRDANVFILDDTYMLRYIQLCDLIIEEWNSKEMGYIKTLGIEAVEGEQTTLTKADLIAILKNEFSITTCKSLVT